MLRYRLREINRTYFPRPEGMSATLHALLIQRGIASAEDAERFLNPLPEYLHDPMLLNAMDRVVPRIRTAMEAGENVCVYGDYDVDGVSASAILAAYLRSCGVPTEVYLPSRHTEGYGLNEEAIRGIAERNTLMITVDCGVTSVELIALAKSLGLDCIVTDHHRPAEILPDCPVVNPLLNGYPFPSLCGAGVAFKLVQALGGLEAAMEYVDIAALATVADVVPLTDENRVIVKWGLERINTNPRPGIQALIDGAGLADKKIGAGNIAFQLAPRLNAGGRLGSARRSHNLLLSPTLDEARGPAAELEQENADRKQIEQEILAAAEKQLEGFDFPAHRALVVAGEGWNAGVIGLAASRLVEKYHYPSIVLSDNDGVLTGSCRSIVGVDIHAALTAVQQHLIRFGGHKQAAGLTLARENLEAFRAELDAWLSENVSPMCYIPDQEYDMAVHFDELTTSFVNELEALQPTGFGNPAPVLRSTAFIVTSRAVGAEGAHLSVQLSENGTHKKGIFFRGGPLEDRLPDTVDVLFTPKLNTFMGRTDVQLELKAVNSGDVLAEISAKVEEEDVLQHEFLTNLFYNKRINFFNEDAGKVSPDEVKNLLAESPQGTLILAADMAEAGRLADAFAPTPFDLFVGELPEDGRRFNALCVYPPDGDFGGYRKIILAGVPGISKVPDGAKVMRLNVKTKWLKDLPDVDGMREVYKALLRLSKRPVKYDRFINLTHLLACDTGIAQIGCAASVLALHDMKLVELDLNALPIAVKLMPMQKTDPDSSAVWRAVSKWREQAHCQ